MAHNDHEAHAAATAAAPPSAFLRNLIDLRHRMRPGARVRVIQQIAARHYAWGTAHIGTVMKYEQKQTGSWYAHSRGEKLWLDRLMIRKDDGEIFTFNLDEYTHLDILADAPAGETPAAIKEETSPANMPEA